MHQPCYEGIYYILSYLNIATRNGPEILGSMVGTLRSRIWLTDSVKCEHTPGPDLVLLGILLCLSSRCPLTEVSYLLI